MQRIIEKIKNNLSSVVIYVLGVFVRFIAMIHAYPLINQHDVEGKYNWMGYAVYIFNNWTLPNSNKYEYSQPPINSTLQAIVMKILSPFIRYSKINYKHLFGSTRILSFIYSCITLYIIYKILKEFEIKKALKNFVFAIMALYPGIVFMTTQYSNDNIAYMFFYLSLFLSIRWAKDKKVSTIILLALSIGLGMLTKISVGLIAFITGPMMLAVLIKANDKKKISMQLIVFAIIVFPIGLSYSIRNYVLFGQQIGSIYEVGMGSTVDLKMYNYTIFDRFLSFPINRIIEKNNGIYHDFSEYNVWIDLIKTSTYDEFNFGNGLLKSFLTLLYFANIIFYIIGIVAVVITIIDVIKMFVNRVAFDNPYLNFKMICIMLFALALFAYISFNIRYPYTCNSNYRYISYITFALAGSIASTIFKSNK